MSIIKYYFSLSLSLKKVLSRVIHQNVTLLHDLQIQYASYVKATVETTATIAH